MQWVLLTKLASHFHTISVRVHKELPRFGQGWIRGLGDLGSLLGCDASSRQVYGTEVLDPYLFVIPHYGVYKVLYDDLSAARGGRS